MQTNGNRHHSEGVADTNAAWAEYVNGLVHRSTMDVLHAVVDEVTKLIEGVNGDFNKSIDVCDAKIKAAIATCERASAEMRSNVPVPVGNSILLATDIESGDAPALCERFVA
jgi:hypothetical protein